ncbi:MAG: succinate dehydrogenase cytochrome b subunit [Akkermansiaceae bacterium]|nr:succinate dehydrogenase cytochrome b subunit [Akkermansiaceae bacterium]
MNALTRCLDRYWSSSIGKKLIVAITGIVLVLFLAGHVAGNFLIYAGPKAFNEYAYFLHHMLHGAGIWIARIGLLVAFVAHIAATIALTKQNKTARKSYECKNTIQASRSSLIMIWSGLTILAFVVYHILHFTIRAGNEYDNPELYYYTVDGKELHNAWLMVIHGFSWWPATLFYVVAITLLCSHLMHGVGSIFQTLGWRTKKNAALIKQFSIGYALIIWLGFISIPLSIYLFPGFFEALKHSGH